MGKVASKDLVEEKRKDLDVQANGTPVRKVNSNQVGEEEEEEATSKAEGNNKSTFTKLLAVELLNETTTTTTSTLNDNDHDDLSECCRFDCCRQCGDGSKKKNLDCKGRWRPLRLAASTCCAACRDDCSGSNRAGLLVDSGECISTTSGSNSDKYSDQGRTRAHLAGATNATTTTRGALERRRAAAVVTLAERAREENEITSNKHLVKLNQQQVTLFDGQLGRTSGKPFEGLTFSKRSRQRRPSSDGSNENDNASEASSTISPNLGYASQVGLSIKAPTKCSLYDVDELRVFGRDEQDPSTAAAAAAASNDPKTFPVEEETILRRQLDYNHLLYKKKSELKSSQKQLKLINSTGTINRTTTKPISSQTSPEKQPPNSWNGISIRFGRMSRHREQPLVVANDNHPDQRQQHLQRASPRKPGSSCFCLLISGLLRQLFPIFDGFSDFSVKRDLLNELVAGITIAIMHIPQGMAYGLLAGVDPIYGLNVSFVPVLVMAFMGKSRHVSYGTFAVISMLLANSLDSVRLAFKEQHQQQVAGPTNPTGNRILQVLSDSGSKQGPSTSIKSSQASVVLTNNHRPADEAHSILRNLLAQGSSANQAPQDYASDTSATTTPEPSGLSPPTDLFEPLLDSPSSARHLSTGPTDGLEMPTNIEILTCVCLVCGVVHLAMCLMRLGVLSLMFSDQLVSSFTTASAFHVLTSQLAGLFDLTLAPIHGETFKIFRTWWAFGRALVFSFVGGGGGGGGSEWRTFSSGEEEDGPIQENNFSNINQVTGLLSLLSILFLLLVKQLVEPTIRRNFKSFTCLPSELVLMVIVTLSSWYWSLSSHYNVRIIGQVPAGLPAPQAPRLDLVPLVLWDSLTIALISFAMNLSLAQVYANKFKYKLDSNQELFALGTANVVASFFSCFPCASSLSRSAVQSNFNVRSQLCSLVSCSIVILIICYLTSALYDLPRSTLSCIIIVALRGVLVQVRDLYDTWKSSKLDGLVWLTTFMSVIMFGVTYGLIMGIIFSLSMVFLSLLAPNYSLLGRLPGTDIYVDLEAFAECKPLDRITIFRFNSALCYLNRQMFRSIVEKLLPNVYKPQSLHALCLQLYQNHRLGHGSWRLQETSSPGDDQLVEFLILDCSGLSYCDHSGVHVLLELAEELDELGVPVYLAACPLRLVETIEGMKGKTHLVERNIFPTISEAVKQASYLRDLRTSARLGANGKGGQLATATTTAASTLANRLD